MPAISPSYTTNFWHSMNKSGAQTKLVVPNTLQGSPGMDRNGLLPKITGQISGQSYLKNSC